MSAATVAAPRRRWLSGTALAVISATLLSGALLAPLVLTLAERSPITGLREVLVWTGVVATLAYAAALATVLERRAAWRESALAFAALALVLLAVEHWTGWALVPLSGGARVGLLVTGLAAAGLGASLARLYFAHGLVWWVVNQIGLLLGLVGTALLVGLWRAIATRRFHWDAFVAGLAVMELGLGAVAAVVAFAPEQTYLWRDELIWGGTMATMLVAGFVIGRLGRRLGYWESYLALLVTVAVVVVHLAVGWHRLLGIGPGEAESHFDFLVAMPPGVRIFGSMWQRMVALGAVAAFLVTIFGGSLAYLFFADEGRWDPRFSFERLIGQRHLLGRGAAVSTTALVAVLGVAGGVASLVTVTAVMSGYQNDIQAKILTTNAHFVVQKYGLDFTEYDEIADEALADPEVLAATPFIFNEAMLATSERGLGVLIKGILPAEAGQVTGIEGNLCASFTADGVCTAFPAGGGPHLPALLASERNLPSLVVGSELFKKLEQPLGAVVTLTTPVGIAGARGNAPRRLQFRLGGVFRSGMHDFDVRLAYLDLAAAQRLMGLGEAVNGLELKVRDPERVELVAERVLNRIGRYPYRTLDWRELNIGIFTALKLQKIVMFLVLTFIIIVAAFNIASTLFMAVVEKAREIAVLKSMGARDASVMKVFVLEGWFVGGVGTLVGLVLGLGVCLLLAEAHIGIAADVYMVESLSVRLQPLEVGVTAVATLVISHLATLYPALKAARQRPVDAMRYE